MPFAAITTTGKVGLLLVAGTFIGFSLVVAMVVPRSRPTFPGRRVGLFVTVAAALFAAQLATVWWVAETQEVEAEAAGPGETETGPAQTETGPAQTETAPSARGDAAAGKQVFASAGCTACHTLKDAGSTGTVGPNLDAVKPSYDKVVTQVTNGGGAMPPFKDKLSEQQIRDVAAYVTKVTSGS